MSIAPTPPAFMVQHLSALDDALMNALLSVLGEAFDGTDTCGAHHPRPAYIRQLRVSDTFIALAA
jgi:hypothetical protein